MRQALPSCPGCTGWWAQKPSPAFVLTGRVLVVIRMSFCWGPQCFLSSALEYSPESGTFPRARFRVSEVSWGLQTVDLGLNRDDEENGDGM